MACIEDDLPSSKLDWNLADESFWDFLGPWLGRAADARRSGDHFESLIFLWVSFNAWLSQVVEDEKLAYKGRDLVRVGGADERLAGRFAELATPEGVRGQFYRAFHALSPVFQVRALVSARIPPWRLRRETREKYRARSFKNPNLRRGSWSPQCFLFHQPPGTAPDGYRAEHVPFDWLHTLDAIYQVRCNLFHGGKTFTSGSDAKIVKLSLTILWEVWTTSQAVPEEHLLLKDRRVSIAEGGDHEP